MARSQRSLSLGESGESGWGRGGVDAEDERTCDIRRRRDGWRRVCASSRRLWGPLERGQGRGERCLGRTWVWMEGEKRERLGVGREGRRRRGSGLAPPIAQLWHSQPTHPSHRLPPRPIVQRHPVPAPVCPSRSIYPTQRRPSRAPPGDRPPARPSSLLPGPRRLALPRRRRLLPLLQLRSSRRLTVRPPHRAHPVYLHAHEAIVILAPRHPPRPRRRTRQLPPHTRPPSAPSVPARADSPARSINPRPSPLMDLRSHPALYPPTRLSLITSLRASSGRCARLPLRPRVHPALSTPHRLRSSLSIRQP